MKVELLGTAGAGVTPRPGCGCRVCVEARAKGVPYSRAGPGLFVHGPDLLIDTSEDIVLELNRSRVDRVRAGLYSHWHPDHVMGRRVWEVLQTEWRRWPRQPTRRPIYLPQGVAADFRAHLGGREHLAYMQERGWVGVVEIPDGESIELDGARVTPFRLAEEYVYAFVLEENGRRALIAMDELNGWTPPEWVRGVDLAVIPMGVVELDPFTGERRIPVEHPILRAEATFAETLGMVDELGADRVVMTHIEEMDGVSYGDLKRLELRLPAEGRNVTFAYDTMLVDL